MISLSIGGAQQAEPPKLQSRSASQPDDRAAIVLRNHAKSVLPQEASGLYRFGDTAATIGEGIEIDEQFGDISGYLTIKAKPDHGKPSLQSYFFNRVEGGGGDLAFITKPVHGAWYSFEGKILRGSGLSRAEDGFFLMQGDLIAHDDGSKTTQRRTISLKQTGLR
jgi:hypothetical protein